ncbi:hypothetical protein [Actinacidiphila sp. bgisy160]|uniref:hypothetical protein n=1 Tax=Actinacidiphila sp. bgisy160 TaxID=3413796 RepID=UPI003D70F198
MTHIPSATDAPPPPTPPLPVREIVGLVLVVLGVAGLTAVAFAVHPLLGGAAVGLALTGLGLFLSLGDSGAV